MHLGVRGSRVRGLLLLGFLIFLAWWYGWVGLKHLLPRPTTWVQSPGPTRWKKKVNASKLSFDFYMCEKAYVCVPTHRHKTKLKLKKDLKKNEATLSNLVLLIAVWSQVTHQSFCMRWPFNCLAFTTISCPPFVCQGELKKNRTASTSESPNLVGETFCLWQRTLRCLMMSEGRYGGIYLQSQSAGGWGLSSGIQPDNMLRLSGERKCSSERTHLSQWEDCLLPNLMQSPRPTLCSSHTCVQQNS